ncbi:MAG: PIN domain-containing protein [Balneolaceae bacterium]
MKRLFIDTNILLRYITGEPKEQADRAYQFISETTERRTQKLIIADSVIMETVFTLRSFYKLSPADIETRVTPFLDFSETVNPSKTFDWFEVFRIEQSKGVDFIDALHYLLMRQESIDTIVSFDTDFDKFKDISRQEP